MKTDIFGLFRSDNGQHIAKSAVSKKYQPHQTEQIADLAEMAAQAFGSGMELTVQGKFKNGHVVVLTPSDDMRESVGGADDVSYPTMVIRAGYNGKAYQAQLGLFRIPCSNLAIIQVRGTCVSMSVRHTLNFHDRLNVIQSQFAGLIAQWPEVIAIARTMGEKRVSVEKIISELWESPTEAGKGLTMADIRKNKIVARLERESLELNQPRESGWLVWNAIQGYLQHDTSRKGDSVTRALQTWTDSRLALATDLILAG